MILRFTLTCFLIGILGACGGSETLVGDGIPPRALDQVVVEASCGQCQFDLEGSGCDLAIRVDGRAYYVDGTAINEHGDAHAEDGFCNAIRPARVSGRFDSGRFVVTSFELVPAETQR